MESFLLTSKVQIPPQLNRGVQRTRLLDAIEHGIPRCKLLLVSAPAGYGKTTLLSQWSHASRFPVAWLSISKEDNDLERFSRYLLTAWMAVQPGVNQSPLGLLLSGRLLDTEALLPAFINAANEAPGQVVFVLDDYHLIRDSAIQQAVTFLLDHLPPSLHFVLSSRGEPELPLARYRARNELIEFRAAALSFSPEETRVFLNEMMGLDLAGDEVSRLHVQLEGWIAGLQLAALSLRQRLTDADKLVVGGRHRFIADYLSEDVLAPLTDNVRRFLLQTSILDRLCGSLCNALTEREDGQRMLETVERENLFLTPLDDRREWFRYHHLFADFLREELKKRNPDKVVELHRRATRWYLEQDLPEQAFQHAVGADDAELVVQILERCLFTKLLGGEIRLVQRWLDALPEAWQSDYPMIIIARAGVLLATGQFDACARCLDQVDQLALATDEMDLHRARVTAMRCNIACFQNDLTRAEALADQALRGLSEDDLGFRAGIYGALGDTYRRNGRWREAQESYLKLLDFSQVPAFRIQAAHVYGAIADLDLRQGHLRDAASSWRKALSAIQKRENWGRLPLPVIGWVFIRLGEVLYEWDELAEAWDHLSDGLKRAELGGDVRAMIAGYLIAGRLKLTEGDIESAAEYLERTRPLVEKAQFSHWVSRFERFQLELWLAQDRLRAAVNWSDEMLIGGTLEGRPETEIAQLAVARVLIIKADGQSLERALSLLEPLLQAAEETGREGVFVEGLALQALGLWQRGRRADAMTALERALRMAEPEGYVRTFADLGLPMGRLLQEAHSRAVMPAYLETLLAAFGADVTFPAATEGTLVEPLTPREQQILELLAAGLTNPEIAEALVISPGTVKKHAGNIYGKLGVHSRTAAAARARELDLLR